MADVAALHNALVDALLRRGAITDPHVEAAFRAIPRHLFLPDVPLAEVYRDQHARAWSAAGRPGSDGLRIRALPIDAAYTPAPREQVIEKRWTRLVLDWPDQVERGKSKPR